MLFYRGVPVMGTHFRSKEEKKVANSLDLGDRVGFADDSDGAHGDTTAVAVVTEDGTHIGYIQKEINPGLWTLLSQGFTFEGVVCGNDDSKARRLLLDIHCTGNGG